MVDKNVTKIPWTVIPFSTCRNASYLNQLNSNLNYQIMKSLILCIAFCCILNRGNSQHIYIREFSKKDKHFSSLIIAKDYSEVITLIDTNNLRDRAHNELILLAERDYKIISSYLHQYKAIGKKCAKPVFFITEFSEQGNFGYELKGKNDIKFFFKNLKKFINDNLSDSIIKNKFENYYDKVSERI